MLSTLSLEYDILEEAKAISLEEVVNPKAGLEVNVYIPKLMQLIDKGEPMTMPAKTSISCFVNAGDCAIELTPGLEEKNYFTGKFQNNSTSLDIINKTDEEGKIIRTFVEQDAELRCAFKNNKLKQLQLNTDINADDEMTDFHFFHFKNDHGFGGTFTPSPYNSKNPYADINKEPGKKGSTKVNTSAKPNSGSSTYTKNKNAGTIKRQTS